MRLILLEKSTPIATPPASEAAAQTAVERMGCDPLDAPPHTTGYVAGASFGGSQSERVTGTLMVESVTKTTLPDFMVQTSRLEKKGELIFHAFKKEVVHNTIFELRKLRCAFLVYKVRALGASEPLLITPKRNAGG